MSKPHRYLHIASTGNICVYCLGAPIQILNFLAQSFIGYV